MKSLRFKTETYQNFHCFSEVFYEIDGNDNREFITFVHKNCCGDFNYKRKNRNNSKVENTSNIENNLKSEYTQKCDNNQKSENNQYSENNKTSEKNVKNENIKNEGSEQSENSKIIENNRNTDNNKSENNNKNQKSDRSQINKDNRTNENNSLNINTKVFDKTHPIFLQEEERFLLKKEFFGKKKKTDYRKYAIENLLSFNFYNFVNILARKCRKEDKAKGIPITKDSISIKLKNLYRKNTRDLWIVLRPFFFTPVQELKTLSSKTLFEILASLEDELEKKRHNQETKAVVAKEKIDDSKNIEEIENIISKI